MKQKQFIAGQMYELTQLLAHALAVETKHAFYVREYILGRLDELNKEIELLPPVRQSSRGAKGKNN